jgi:hypothetical protein
MIQRLLRKAAVILANGYILFFFSERVFWSSGVRVTTSLSSW